MADASQGGSSMAAMHADWYAQLQGRLNELHYRENLDPNSAQLVDHLLQDLLKSVESFHLLKQRYEDVLHDPEVA